MAMDRKLTANMTGSAIGRPSAGPESLAQTNSPIIATPARAPPARPRRSGSSRAAAATLNTSISAIPEAAAGSAWIARVAAAMSTTTPAGTVSAAAMP